MKQYRMHALLLICYCFPFVFFSMYQDFAHRSLIGYGVMIIGLFVLAFLGGRINSITIVVIGNLISNVVSYLLIMHMSSITDWDYYFKPFYPVQIIAVLNIVFFVVQSVGFSWGKGDLFTSWKE